jgi:hypothetical protein
VQQPLLRQLHPNQVWPTDFMSDTLFNRRAYRTLNVIDDCARDVLAIEIDFSVTGERVVRVVRVLQQLCEWHGKPDAMGSGNGREFRSHVLQVWAKCNGINGSSLSPVAQHTTRTSNDSTARSVSSSLMLISSRVLIRLALLASSGSPSTTSNEPTAISVMCYRWHSNANGSYQRLYFQMVSGKGC